MIYYCKCGYPLEHVDSGYFEMIIHDANEESPTYGKQALSCPGCGQAFLYLTDLLTEDEHQARLAEQERDRRAACFPALVEALEAVEWVLVPAGWGSGRYECPWCENDKARGHAPNCQRETALALARGEEGET